ncbi:hypothetical protein [Streptomyces sp. NPDC052015]|uniref:hypothetical protein n=1 Tax=Streptomyces sp. NPDC052015 TaxID=3154755 RepID=UPI003446E5B2
MFVAPRGAEGGSVAGQAESLREQVRELHPDLAPRDDRDRRERRDRVGRGRQVAVVNDVGDEVVGNERRRPVDERNVPSALHTDDGAPLLPEFQNE